MIGDGHTPYEQLKISPTSTQTEIRNAYLKLRNDLKGEDLTRLQKAWELTWLPEHRATVDAFLFQLNAPTITVQSVVDSLEKDLTTKEWHEYIDESKILEDAANQAKHEILKVIWLEQRFHEKFKREMPSMPRMPAPQPTLTVDLTRSRDSRQASASESPTYSRNVADVHASASLLSVLSGWLYGVFDTTRNHLISGVKIVRAIFTYPTPNSQKTTDIPSLPAPDWTFIQLAIATLVLFVLLSAMGYFFVNLLNASELISVFQSIPAQSAEIPEAKSRLGVDIVPSQASAEQLPDSIEESQFSSSSTENAQQSITQTPTPQISLTELPVDNIDLEIVETVAPTPFPTVIPSPVLIATEEPVILSVSTSYFTNVRQGPGGQYRVLQIVNPGQQLAANARNAQGDWIRVQLRNGAMGWIFVNLVTVDGEIRELPEVPAPSL